MLHVGRIVPVYRLTRGLSAQDAADRHPGRPRPLRPLPRVPAPGGRRRSSHRVGAAIEAAHFPDDFAQRDAAVRRLAHDELLALQVGMVARRRQRRGVTGRAIEVDDATDARTAREPSRRGCRGASARRSS